MKLTGGLVAMTSLPPHNLNTCHPERSSIFERREKMLRSRRTPTPSMSAEKSRGVLPETANLISFVSQIYGRGTFHLAVARESVVTVRVVSGHALRRAAHAANFNAPLDAVVLHE